jgi:hypothetical protein
MEGEMGGNAARKGKTKMHTNFLGQLINYKHLKKKTVRR